MRNIVDIEFSGVIEILEAFDEMIHDAGAMAKVGVDKATDRIKADIANNIRTEGLIFTGALLESVGSAGGVEGNVAFGSAGIYDMPNKVMEPLGFEKGYITRPQLAYWLEHGIAPHTTKSGMTLKKIGREGLEQELLHPGMPPKPIISSAYEKNYVKIQEDMASGFNEKHVKLGLTE